ANYCESITVQTDGLPYGSAITKDLPSQCAANYTDVQSATHIYRTKQSAINESTWNRLETVDANPLNFGIKNLALSLNTRGGYENMRAYGSNASHLLSNRGVIIDTQRIR